MLGQDEQAKMEKFTDTMPTIIQTHLIIEPNWIDITKKAKNLEHIIQNCEALAAKRAKSFNNAIKMVAANVELTHQGLMTLENRTSMMAKAIMPALDDL